MTPQLQEEALKLAKKRRTNATRLADAEAALAEAILLVRRFTLGPNKRPDWFGQTEESKQLLEQIIDAATAETAESRVGIRNRIQRAIHNARAKAIVDWVAEVEGIDVVTADVLALGPKAAEVDSLNVRRLVRLVNEQYELSDGSKRQPLSPFVRKPKLPHISEVVADA